MSKFCTSCGAQLADDATFCTSCGAQQAAKPQQSAAANSTANAASDFAQAAGNLAHSAADSVKQTFDGVSFDSVKDAMSVDNIKNVGKTKDKNTIIGLCAIAVVLVLLIILFANLFGGHAYEKPIENLLKAIEKTDGKAYAEAFPDYINESAEDMLDFYDEYDDVEEYYEEELLKDMLDELEDEYGDKIKLSYKIKDKDKLSDKKLKNLEDDIEDYYDEEVDVTNGYELKIELKVKGKDDDDKETARLNVYKIDGKWCLTTSSFLF